MKIRSFKHSDIDIIMSNNFVNYAILYLVTMILFLFSIKIILRYRDLFFLIESISLNQDIITLSDPWLNELLNKYNLKKINALLIKKSPRPPPLNELLSTTLACALCVPFPVQESIIVLHENLLIYPQTSIRFIMAHELGHIIDQKGIHTLFRANNYLREEITADAFASSIAGKNAAIETLIKLRLKFKGNNGLDMRIMAIYMPTLFRQYA